MPEQREIMISRVALLELKDEHRLAQEGYDLLDEKCILLASEMRRQLIRLRALRAAAHQAEAAARAAVQAAVACHGLDELAVYPALCATDDALHLERASLLGLELIETRLTLGPVRPCEQPERASPEARACALAYRAWLVHLCALGACCLNLRRLVREYVRTERRARAIESVLLPEIDSALKFVEDQLESSDQEENARLRHRRAPRGKLA